MAITTTLLLDAIKRGVTVPSSQVRFSDDDILKFCDEEMESLLVPMITSLRQEFFVKQKNVTVTANQNAYKIPYRAVGRTCRMIKLANTDGSFVRSLALISPEDSQRFYPNVFGEPLGYMYQGDKIVLLPTPTAANYQIQFFYELKPSYLVPVDEAGVISNINTGTGVVTISTAITGFSTGQTMDFVDANAGCSVKGESLDNTNVSGTAITFATTDLPDDLEVGDYVTIANQSPVFQAPDEAHQVLVQAVICRLLEALGDFEGLNAGLAKLEKKIDAASRLLAPRDEGEVPVVINRNGLLRYRPYNYRFRYIV